jgi:hypothetical protein
MHQISKETAKKAALIIAASGVLALGIATPAVARAQEQSGLADRLSAAVESGQLTLEEKEAILKAAKAGLLNGHEQAERG